MVIAVVGEKALMSGESRSRAQLDLPGVQEELIKELVATGETRCRRIDEWASAVYRMGGQERIGHSRNLVFRYFCRNRYC